MPEGTSSDPIFQVNKMDDTQFATLISKIDALTQAVSDLQYTGLVFELGDFRALIVGKSLTIT